MGSMHSSRNNCLAPSCGLDVVSYLKSTCYSVIRTFPAEQIYDVATGVRIIGSTVAQLQHLAWTVDEELVLFLEHVYKTSSLGFVCTCTLNTKGLADNLKRQQ